MRIVYASTASRELAEVWLYNAERYGARRADLYEAFLKGSIDRLTEVEPESKPVEGHHGLWRKTFRQSNRGHGHIVVYRIEESEAIRVLHIYHTAQDWQSRLRRER